MARKTSKTGGAAVQADLQTLNFKVPNAFKREFKVYAAQRGISMLQLLREGFQLSKIKDRSS